MFLPLRVFVLLIVTSFACHYKVSAGGSYDDNYAFLNTHWNSEFSEKYHSSRNDHSNESQSSFFPDTISNPLAHIVGLQTNAEVSVNPDAALDALALSTSLPLANHQICKEYIQHQDYQKRYGSCYPSFGGLFGVMRATNDNMPALCNMVENLCKGLELSRKPLALIFKGNYLTALPEHCGVDFRCNAFAWGFSRLGLICIGEDLIKHLSEDELEAVVAHELSHLCYNHIPKRVVFGGVIFYVTGLLFESYNETLGFLDETTQTALLYSGVNYLNRSQEVEADLSACSIVNEPNALTRALYKMKTILDEKNHLVIDVFTRLTSQHPLAKDRKQYIAQFAQENHSGQVHCYDDV